MQGLGSPVPVVKSIGVVASRPLCDDHLVDAQAESLNKATGNVVNPSVKFDSMNEIIAEAIKQHNEKPKTTQDEKEMIDHSRVVLQRKNEDQAGRGANGSHKGPEGQNQKSPRCRCKIISNNWKNTDSYSR